MPNLNSTPFYSIRKLDYILLFLLLILPEAGFSAKPEGGKSTEVIVAPVKAIEISDRVEALGTAKANESVAITASVTEKVREVHFDDGMLVKAGETMVILEHAEEKANLEHAKAVLNDKELALNRQLKLEKSKLASIENLDRARLEVQQAKANIIALNTQINDRIIRAPFAGQVGLRNISVGALVKPGDLITTLDDIQLIKLDFSVPENLFNEIKSEQQIEARTPGAGHTIYQGNIKSVDSRVDQVTRSFQVRAVLPNPEGRIAPGMLLQVDLLRNKRPALLVPESALLPLAEKQFVLLRTSQDSKETVERREVTIGTRINGMVEIRHGLTDTDQVVTHGNDKAKPGGVIKILAVDDGTLDITKIIRGDGKKGKQP